MPYFTKCLKCGYTFNEEVAFCKHCGTDEWLISEPYEIKDRSK